MKNRLFLILLFCSVALLAFAQTGGVKGKVLERGSKIALDGVRVILQGVSEQTTYTEKGVFIFTKVPAGDYKLIFEAVDYRTLEVNVKVENEVKDLHVLSIVAECPNVGEIDGDFADLDTETADDAPSMPIVLSASKDIFNNIASYKFSSVRFRLRGYDNGMSDVYLNGIYLNDALAGYSPWSLWSGLNDVTRNQEISTGLEISDYGLGGVSGTTNINVRASQMRKGFRASLVNANNAYRFRLMLSYASGENEKGWSYAVSASTRQSGNDWIKGVYYNAWAYFASIEKRLNDANRLALTVFGAPTQRGVQTGSTQEVYDLVGSNYYNANWGKQNGDKRNARVRRTHEPVVVLNYYYQPDDKFNLQASVSYRFGQNGYSALDWYDVQDPRPDYYKYLPSYYNDNFEMEAWVKEGWRTDWNVRQINWDHMYNVNYNSLLNSNKEFWGNPIIADGTTRSKYAIEERHTDQRDFNAKIQAVSLLNDYGKLSSGFEFRRNKTEYYKEIKDLLGGDYWLDVDQFAERDFGKGDVIQNNLETPNRLVKKGDKYGYDYNAHLISGKLWTTCRFNRDRFEGYAGLECGYTTFWREGLYRKGLFVDNSKGDSKKQNFWTYTIKVGLTYKIAGNQFVYANFGYMTEAPFFQDAFISPRTRNSVMSDLTTEKILSADLNYSLRLAAVRLRMTGYFTTVKGKIDLISFYDDQNRAFTNYAMNGINQQYAGLEFGIAVPLIAGIEAQGALSYGKYIYTSNPYVTQTVDNSGKVISNERVYWKDMKIGGTPQTATSIGLNYRGPYNIYAGIDLNYFNAMYIDMNPLYRTDRALVNYDKFSPVERQAMYSKMVRQERYGDYYIMNANFSKSWYLNRRYNLGFSLEVKNILNNQDIKTGGYEQMRLKRNTIEGGEQFNYYSRFDTKYFYMMGTVYYLNVYLRF